jgi:hypothetical protein
MGHLGEGHDGLEVEVAPEAQVPELDPPVRHDEDVRGLDVPVHDALPVHVSALEGGEASQPIIVVIQDTSQKHMSIGSTPLLHRRTIYMKYENKPQGSRLHGCHPSTLGDPNPDPT